MTSNKTTLTTNEINAFTLFAVGFGSEGRSVTPSLSWAGQKSGYTVGVLQWDFHQRNSADFPTAYNTFLHYGDSISIVGIKCEHSWQGKSP